MQTNLPVPPYFTSLLEETYAAPPSHYYFWIESGKQPAVLPNHREEIAFGGASLV